MVGFHNIVYKVHYYNFYINSKYAHDVCINHLKSRYNHSLQQIV